MYTPQIEGSKNMDIIFKVLRYLKKYSNLIKSVIFIALFVFCIVQAVQLTNFKDSYKNELRVNSELKDEVAELKNQNATYLKQLEEKDIKIKELESSNQKKETPKVPSEKVSTNVTSTEQESPLTGEYPEATQIWKVLKDLGLNDYVCAGIMGNIMAEVGGQTLDISRWPQYSNGSHYGICQWGGSRRTRLLNDFGKSLEAQITFLSVELYEEIPKDSSFYSMKDEKQAALYFAEHFERCGSGSYNVRQKNATKALEYFTK